MSLTLPTSGGRSVGTVRSRTQATEFSLLLPGELLLHDVLHTNVFHLPQHGVKDLPADGRGTLYHNFYCIPRYLFSTKRGSSYSYSSTD
jgi:hypothetical protein